MLPPDTGSGHERFQDRLRNPKVDRARITSSNSRGGRKSFSLRPVRLSAA